MPTLAIALVLVAAVLHAGWNVLLKTSTDTLWTAVRLQAIGTAILLPVGIVAWLANGMPAVPLEAIGLALAVRRARGDLLRVPVVGLPARRAVARLPAGPGQRAAARRRSSGSCCSGSGWRRSRSPASACLLAGILLVSRPWRALQAAGAAQRGAIGFALATGASIAAYSAVDRLGVRLTEPWIYGSMLAVIATTLLADHGHRRAAAGLRSAPGCAGDRHRRRRSARCRGTLPRGRPRPRRASDGLRARCASPACSRSGHTCSSSSRTRSRRSRPWRRCGNRGSCSRPRGARSGSARRPAGARRPRESPPRASWWSARSRWRVAPLSRAAGATPSGRARGARRPYSWRCRNRPLTSAMPPRTSAVPTRTSGSMCSWNISAPEMMPMIGRK